VGEGVGMEMGKVGEGREHQLIFAIVCKTALPKYWIYNVSGCLAGKGVQRGEGRTEGGEKKGEGRDRKWRSGIAPREKFLRASMLHFISTKLVYRWKASHQNGK